MSEEKEDTLSKYTRTEAIVDRVRKEWETEERTLSVQWQDSQTVHLMPEDGRRYSSFEDCAADCMHAWRGEGNVGDLGRNRKDKYVEIAADKKARNRSWIED